MGENEKVYKFGMIEVMFPVVEQISEIITAFGDRLDVLAISVIVDAESKQVEILPFLEGGDKPEAGVKVGALGDDIHRSKMPQRALLVYFYEAVTMIIKDAENGIKG